MSMDRKVELNEDIRNSAVKARTPKKTANSSTTEWNIATQSGEFSGEHWPSHLPRPPSRKKITEEPIKLDNVPSVIVFNANTPEGASLVRVLSEKGLRVVAIVRVFTSRTAKQLIKLANVTVKVADLNNRDAVRNAAMNCHQAFLVTKYWERFENPIEEEIAKNVVNVSAEVGIQRMILATFEDIGELKSRNRKSQLIPTTDGRIFPKFDGMRSIDEFAKCVGISLTHMFTSYLDDNVIAKKKSLILIRQENGKIISQSHIQERTN
jgi:NAD(P)-dependent dehydrogenase (short-subunit alcohol dehydrogenase family)